MAVSAARVVFLDKDGTIIEDLPYNVDPALIRLAPGSDAGLRRLGAAGFGVAVITNQSGVARGYFDMQDIDAVASHLRSELGARGVPLVGFYVCPHLPEGINDFAIDCDCRKPRTGLLLRATQELRLDPAACWMVGDTWMDVAAGKEAGCSTIMLGPDAAEASRLPEACRPDHAVKDLDEASRIIVADAAEAWGPGARPAATPAVLEPPAAI